ncbi:unnamed protein product, partial [Owenia fusiformis]
IGQMEKMIKIISHAKNNQFIKYGIPFFILVAGGSFGLKHFTSIRFEYKASRQMIKNKSEVEKMLEEEKGIKLKPKEDVTIEKIYEEVEKKDIDTWSNVRGPRPWEDSKQVQKEFKAQAAST